MTEDKLREIESEMLNFIDCALFGPADFLPKHVVKDLVNAAISCFWHLLNGDTESAASDRINFYTKQMLRTYENRRYTL